LSAAATFEIDRAAHQRALVRLLGVVCIGIGVFLTGYVINEPAPYEIYMVGLIAIWALFGLRVSRTVAPLLVMLCVFNIGGLISMTQMDALKDTPLYIAVSLFLAFTAVFYAAVIERDHTLLPVIFRAYTAAAVFTSALGMLGYFHVLPGTEMFTLYDRARGGFQDPNVFGPFLLLPAAWLTYGILKDRPAKAPLLILGLLIITLGVFLSFSRAAWGMMALVVLMVAGIAFLGSQSARLRLRIILLFGAALVFLAVALVIALQFPSVSDMFTDRAKLVQDYDGARLGRFARHWIGYGMAMEHPLGIGPLVFGQTLGEDTHNIWLKALLDYSWLGFAAYMAMTWITLGIGFKLLFRQRPWQSYLICAYSVYVAHVFVGNIIDTDHWRHFYLLLGIIWGSYALEKRHQLTQLRTIGSAFPGALTSRA
jgi:O-antigen ligase